MMSVNLDESWSSTTERSLDKAIRYLLALTYSRDYSWDALHKLPWKVSWEVEGQRGRDRGIQEAADLKNRNKDWNSPKSKHSSTWNTSSSSSSSAWRDWSSDQTRERSDWQSLADWNSSDETRERTALQPAGWVSSDQTRQATAWQWHYLWQWGHLHRSSHGHPWRRK